MYCPFTDVNLVTVSEDQMLCVTEDAYRDYTQLQHELKSLEADVKDLTTNSAV